ncbi:HK97 family phage major capsid protein [Rhodococcus sp. AG1013]|uniref:phage major capsid protein n=1 Tax=Rhodococcus sp. AG1013 TaxID=2183996 RepID=UPI000E0C72B6|nr:phage major capsid protein [Rhodococcus sp. AG1013]RDI12040.1 HK97 family phage major capsid protein [Rhodococcus sp. AG1013]
MNKTIEELKAERAQLLTEAEDIARIGADMTTREADRFDEIENRIGDIDRQIERGEKSIERAMRLAEAGSVERGTDPGLNWRTEDPRNALRDNARREIERSHKAELLTDKAAENAERLSHDPNAARLFALTGTDAYGRAFAKMAADPDRGHLSWTADEARAYRDVREFASERGLLESGTGQYVVPFQLDPTVNLTNAGAVNPLREISRVVTTTSNAWHGVTSAGVSAEWLAEANEAADASPTLAQPEIVAHKGAAYVQYSFELEQDGPTILRDLQMMLADARANKEAAAFITGSGVGQPKGLITALVAAGGPIIVDGNGTEALAAKDTYDLQNGLPSRWQPNARFAGNLTTWNAFRQMETTNGSLKFPGLQAVPMSLLGRPAHEVSGIDGTINTGATESNYVLVYGDFSQFLIVDRIGTTVELVPHVFGANRRPTGERGLFVHYRVGSDALIPNAFRVLRVNTTA